MSDSEADSSFNALPPRVRRRIDRVFDRITLEASSSMDGAGTEPSHKKRRLDDIQPGGFVVENSATAGGFIVDSPASGGFLQKSPSPGGGFLPALGEDAEGELSSPNNYIPLQYVPSALQLLDLQPDDEDVLSVFRNAATGWENKQAHRSEVQDETHLLVSRKDWRAVCAALLDVGGQNEDEEMTETDGKVEGEEDKMDGETSEDEYEDPDSGSEPDEDDGDSDDDYEEGGFMRPREKPDRAPKSSSTRRKRRGATQSSSMDTDEDEDFDEASRRITVRQKAESRKAFSLFFPDVPDNELDRKRIMIKDITRIAGLLKEKLTAEEVRCNKSTLWALNDHHFIDCRDARGVLDIPG
jgi:hypothetical protein